MSGLKSKMKEIRAAVATCDYDIIVLVETWLDPGVLSTEVFDSSWVVFRQDRCPENSAKLKGGGVLIAARNQLDVSLVSLPTRSVEQVWVRLNLQTSVALLGSVYLPPDVGVHKCVEFVETVSYLVFDCVSIDADDPEVLGDFNLPNLHSMQDELNEVLLHPVNVTSDKDCYC